MGQIKNIKLHIVTDIKIIVVNDNQPTHKSKWSTNDSSTPVASSSSPTGNSPANLLWSPTWSTTGVPCVRTRYTACPGKSSASKTLTSQTSQCRYLTEREVEPFVSSTLPMTSTHNGQRQHGQGRSRHVRTNEHSRTSEGSKPRSPNSREVGRSKLSSRS